MLCVWVIGNMAIVHIMNGVTVTSNMLILWLLICVLLLWLARAAVIVVGAVGTCGWL